MIRINLMNSKAFTLIEIIIVMVILGFLAAMLVPNLKPNFTKAYHDDACTNLKTMHAAQQPYRETAGAYYSDTADCTISEKTDTTSLINNNLGINVTSTGGTKYYCCADNDCRAYLKNKTELKYSECTGTT